MEETLRQKQLFLRENILDKGYSTDNFMDLLHSKKGEQGLDLNNWSMRELSSIVKEFISYENQYDNQDNINKYIETDEDYEQRLLQDYNEQKRKENQEYTICTKLNTKRFGRNDDNINIKVSLPNKKENKELGSGDYVVETFPYNYQVRRNFEDFEWILNYLNKEFMNYVIPKFSNKNYGDKLTEEKALKRTRTLTKFLERIAEHPTLKYINIINDFLTINSEEDFDEIKKQYTSRNKSEENRIISLEDIKSLNGKIKISISKEKEVYFMNIKDNTKINETILKKLNKSYKDLIEIMNNACDKMKEISDLWKLFSDKSLKYYETSSTIESYKIMNKIMEELLISEKKKINIFNTNIREYYRFMKNEFNVLNNLANKVDNYKDNYYKALDKLKQDKEKLFKEQDIKSWGLDNDYLKHKNIFLKNKELAFSKMLPEETNNVLNMKNLYGAFLNSLIDEYERIRLLNGKKNKENTIQILKLLGGQFKFINISCESHITNLVQFKDEEIKDDNEFKNIEENNLFSNNFNKNKKNNQFNNNNRQNNQINYRSNNNSIRMNNSNQVNNNRNIINQPRKNNNQLDENNNQNQNMNMNRAHRSNTQNINQNINQNRNQYNRFNTQTENNRVNNNQQNRNINNNINNNIFNRNRINQNEINNNNGNIQFNRNNNNIQFNRNRSNNQNDMNNNNNSYQNNINNRNINQEQKRNENINKPDFYDINNINDYKNNFDDDNYDFRLNRNNDINIYEF